jgi:hypothetical protein
VLVGFKRGTTIIHDPALGVCRLREPELSRRLSSEPRI